MLRVNKGRVPILSVDPNPDSKTLDQALLVANLPYVAGHVALMGDTHLGYGFPIGCVAGLEGTVSPYAVGNDIGCGMIAARMQGVTEGDLRAPASDGREMLKKIGETILARVPVGFARREEPLDVSFLESALDGQEMEFPVIAENIGLAGTQLGTLGGGNHFMEIQVEDANDSVWLMIHSGSRGLGGAVCKAYHKRAEAHTGEAHRGVPRELAGLPVDDTWGRRYAREHDLCLEFAERNRAVLLEETLGAMSEALGPNLELEEATVVQTHHNFFSREQHFGREVFVHRKGAVRATRGTRVTIPGSMTTASYIAEGLGNPDFLDSCSHGAGRVMSRRQAKKTLSVEDMLGDLAAKRIYLFTPKRSTVIDEWGPVYKDVHRVMEWQRDLVRPLHRLRPLAVIKG